jgi:hypothetical protein
MVGACSDHDASDVGKLPARGRLYIVRCRCGGFSGCVCRLAPNEDNREDLQFYPFLAKGNL